MENIIEIYDHSEKNFFEQLKAKKTDMVRKAPFHVICRGNSVKMLKYIFEKYADEHNFSELLKLPDIEKRTPLHYASELATSEIAAILIKEEAEIIKDKSGKNALHIAARFGNVDVAKLLLSYRKDELLDEEDDFYETPLFHAARYKKDKFVIFLLAK